MKKRARNAQMLVFMTATIAVAVVLGIVVSGPGPLVFKVMSGEVVQFDHGVSFYPDDPDETGGRVCLEPGAYGTLMANDNWKSWVKIEGAHISPSKKRSFLAPCRIQVRRVLEARDIN